MEKLVSVPKNDFDQQTACGAPVHGSKYTTYAIERERERERERKRLPKFKKISELKLIFEILGRGIEDFSRGQQNFL